MTKQNLDKRPLQCIRCILQGNKATNWVRNRGVASSNHSPCNGLDIIKAWAGKGEKKKKAEVTLKRVTCKQTHRWPRRQCGWLRNSVTVLPQSGPHSASVQMTCYCFHSFQIPKFLSSISVKCGTDLVTFLLTPLHFTLVTFSLHFKFTLNICTYSVFVLDSINCFPPNGTVTHRPLSELWPLLSIKILYDWLIARDSLQANVIQFGLFKIEYR